MVQIYSALDNFTRFDQVNQLVSASEADADLGFMARTMALCSLPRTNPGNRKEYVRRNGLLPGDTDVYQGGDTLATIWDLTRSTSR